MEPRSSTFTPRAAQLATFTGRFLEKAPFFGEKDLWRDFVSEARGFAIGAYPDHHVRLRRLRRLHQSQGLPAFVVSKAPLRV